MKYLLTALRKSPLIGQLLHPKRWGEGVSLISQLLVCFVLRLNFGVVWGIEQADQRRQQQAGREPGDDFVQVEDTAARLLPDDHRYAAGDQAGNNIYRSERLIGVAVERVEEVRASAVDRS